jgi:hypothetical protein
MKQGTDDHDRRSMHSHTSIKMPSVKDFLSSSYSIPLANIKMPQSRVLSPQHSSIEIDETTWSFFQHVKIFNHTHNNNNQAFYSQASWGRLEMKPHEPKKQGQNKSKK